MKSKLSILTKNSFFNTFNINKMLGKGNRANGVRAGGLSLFIFLIALVYVCSYSYMGINFLKQYNLEHYVPVLFYIITGIFIFMTSIYRTKNVLFDAKDNDMLLSMPIDFKDILASRLLNLYIMNLIYAIVIYFPSALIYGVICSQSIIFFVLSIFMTLILPIIPVIIASLFGFFIAYITSKSNKHKIVELITTFFIFFTVFFSVSYIQKIGMKFVENIQTIEIVLKKYVYPIHLIKEVIANNSITSLVILVVINIIVMALFVGVLSKKYIRIISKLKEERKSINKKEKSYTKNGVVFALLKKELKRYFSCTVYVFNTAFAPILCILFTGYILIFGGNNIISIFNEMGLVSNSLFKVILIITSFFVCLTNTTCSSISLEGRNIWILKSLPIREINIFKCKILLNLLIILPITFICTLLLYLKLKIGIIECIINLILIVVLSVCISQFGLIINLKFPRLDYTTETQVVKQSFSSFISVFVPMIIVLIGSSIFMYLPTNMSIYIVLVLIFTVLVVDVIEYMILKHWGVKAFKKL